MKYILEVIGRLCIGGAEKVAYEIGIHCNPEEYCVHYIVFGSSIGDYEKKLIDNGCKIFHINPPSESYYTFIKTVYKLMKTYNYYAVHSHTMYNSGWFMLLGWICNIPKRISHSHSKRDPGLPTIKKKLYNYFMGKFIRIFSTNYVACGKQAGYFLFGKKLFTSKGIVLLNGIDTEKFAYNQIKRNEIRHDLNIDNNYVIGHVGRLSNVKNQIFLINLMPDILKLVPNAKLLLIGDGEDKIKLKNRTKELNIENIVIFLGSVLDVYNYVNAFDIFAFPSLNEGTPLSLIENQANGLNCIVSDNIPDDTLVTDLITVCPLKNTNRWIEELCKKRVSKRELYSVIIRNKGFDINGMTSKFYNLLN